MQHIDNKNDKKEQKIPNLMKKRLYTLKEAAHYLGRPVFSLRTMLWSGKIPYIRDGRKYYLDIKDMDAYIEQQKVSYI
jgi:excisionase family DNA binding protein